MKIPTIKDWFTLDEVRKFTETDWVKIYAVHNIVHTYPDVTPTDCEAVVTYLGRLTGYNIYVPKIYKKKLTTGLYGSSSLTMSYIRPEEDISNMLAHVAKSDCIPSSIRFSFSPYFRKEDSILR